MSSHILSWCVCAGVSGGDRYLSWWTKWWKIPSQCGKVLSHQQGALIEYKSWGKWLSSSLLELGCSSPTLGYQHSFFSGHWTLELTAIVPGFSGHQTWPESIYQHPKVPSLQTACSGYSQHVHESVPLTNPLSCIHPTGSLSLWRTPSKAGTCQTRLCRWAVWKLSWVWMVTPSRQHL